MHWKHKHNQSSLWQQYCFQMHLNWPSIKSTSLEASVGDCARCDAKHAVDEQSCIQ